MGKAIIAVDYPIEGTKCVRLNFGWITSGKPIYWATTRSTTNLHLQVPSGVFEDVRSEYFMNDPPVTYLQGKKIAHQNPVYHHKIRLNGKVRLSDGQKDVITGTSELCGIKTTQQDYSTFTDYTSEIVDLIGSPCSSIDVFGTGYKKLAMQVISFPVKVYVGFRFWKDTRNVSLSQFGAYMSPVGKVTDNGTSFLATVSNDFRADLIPSNSVLMRELESQIEAQHATGLSQISDLARELVRGYIRRATKPAHTYSMSMEYGTVGKTPSLDSVQQWAESIFPSFSVDAHHSFMNSVSWREMAADAYKDIGYIDNNGIAYLKDAVELKDFAVSYASTLKSVATNRGAKRAKAVAASYLGAHYGWKLTLLDTAQYVKGLRKNKSFDLIQRCASVRKTVVDEWSVTARYQTYYKRKGLSNPSVDAVNAFLEKVDFLPTLENIWDMVPYSFVVDWFTGIGDSLTSIGNLGVLQAYYKVLCSTRSTRSVRKITTDVSSSDRMTLIGDFEEVIFERRSSYFPIAPPAMSLEPASPLSHTVEGVALVVSKLG